jgi:hypothetical protein
LEQFRALGGDGSHIRLGGEGETRLEQFRAVGGFGSYLRLRTGRENGAEQMRRVLPFALRYTAACTWILCQQWEASLS